MKITRRGIFGLFAAAPFVPKAMAAVTVTVTEKVEVAKDVARLAHRTYEIEDCMWTAQVYDEPDDFKP